MKSTRKTSKTSKTGKKEVKPAKIAKVDDPENYLFFNRFRPDEPPTVDTIRLRMVETLGSVDEDVFRGPTMSDLHPPGSSSKWKYNKF